MSCLSSVHEDSGSLRQQFSDTWPQCQGHCGDATNAESAGPSTTWLLGRAKLREQPKDDVNVCSTATDLQGMQTLRRVSSDDGRIFHEIAPEHRQRRRRTSLLTHGYVPQAGIVRRIDDPDSRLE